jgi:hypothetical protein
MDLIEIGWGSVDWIGLAQDRDKWRALVNAVMNLGVPCWKSIKWLHNWWPFEWCSVLWSQSVWDGLLSIIKKKTSNS